MTDKNTWSATVDNFLMKSLITSARISYENGCELLSDARILFENSRYARATGVAILAEEELSKSFILCVCAKNRRWDSQVHKSLRSHRHKQAIVEVMRQYIDWFHDNNKFISQLNRVALVPVSPNTMPDSSTFQGWLAEAEKLIVKSTTIDRYKQRLLYVCVDKNGRVSSKPEADRDTSSEALDRANVFMEVVEHLLNSS